MSNMYKKLVYRISNKIINWGDNTFRKKVYISVTFITNRFVAIFSLVIQIETSFCLNRESNGLSS